MPVDVLVGGTGMQIEAEEQRGMESKGMVETELEGNSDEN